MQRQYPQLRLEPTTTRFMAYGVKRDILMIDQADLWLRNRKGWQVHTTVYITKNQDESLLGKEDATDLGIIREDLDGGPP